MDPVRDVAEVERISNQYGVTPSQVIVVDLDGRSKILRVGRLNG